MTTCILIWDVPENEVVSIEISLVDEGNRYPYPLPVMEAAGRYPSSFYTNLYPYGKVHSLIHRDGAGRGRRPGSVRGCARRRRDGEVEAL